MKRILVLLCSILLTLSLAGCVSPFQQEDEVGEFTPEIDPEPGNSPGTVFTADLWIPLKSRDYFAVRSHTVSVVSGERTEMAVVKELLRQSEPGDVLAAPGWSGLSVLAVSDDNQTLYVTLSKEFLTPPAADADEAAAMARTAVLAISNTLIGLGEYSQVQILVETASSGKVQRPTRKQAGFLGSDENAVLGLLLYQQELILTPQTAVELSLGFVKDRNALGLYDTLYHTAGIPFPDMLSFQTMLLKMPESVEDYHVFEVTMEGKTRATVYVDITFRKDREERVEIRTPILCRQDYGVWKVEYASLEELVL